MKVVQVPLNLIVPNPDQPRKYFTDDELKELTQSIKNYGVLQPLLVKRNGLKSFFLIAGERRYRAAKLAGLERVPVLIKEFSEKDASIIALVENVQRADLSFLEEARAYKKLMDDYHLTQGEISERVSKKQSTISNKIRILSLPEELQELIAEHNLTERHARALLKLKDEVDRKKVAQRIIQHGLNVKQTEKLIEDILSNQEKADRKQRQINYFSYKIYLNTIRKAFNQVKNVEKGAEFSQSDEGDFLEVKIRIPKKVDVSRETSTFFVQV